MDDRAGLLQPAKAPIISRVICRQTAGQVADGTALEEEDEGDETDPDTDDDGDVETEADPVGVPEVLFPPWPGYGG